jgi:hypothetical protein
MDAMVIAGGIGLGVVTISVICLLLERIARRRSMRNLAGKAVIDLDANDFRRLFCIRCKHQDTCRKSPNKISICKEPVAQRSKSLE